MDENLQLLPCPFCGGKAEVERWGTQRQSHITRCTNCGCSLETGETWGFTTWNKRKRVIFDSENKA